MTFVCGQTKAEITEGLQPIKRCVLARVCVCACVVFTSVCMCVCVCVCVLGLTKPVSIAGAKHVLSKPNNIRIMPSGR